MLEKLKNLFRGKDTPKEEIKEAQAVKAGRVSPKQYAKGEKLEGEKAPAKKLERTATAIKKGELTPKQYARGQKPAPGKTATKAATKKAK